MAITKMPIVWPVRLPTCVAESCWPTQAGFGLSGPPVLIKRSMKWRYSPFTNEQWPAAVFHAPESLIQVSLQMMVRARCVPFSSAS